MESNMQKMIEGISEIRKGLHGMLSGKFPIERHFISALLGRCDGLLELPPRNCDVGTAEEQVVRFDAFVRDRRGDLNCTCKCPMHNGVDNKP